MERPSQGSRACVGTSTVLGCVPAASMVTAGGEQGPVHLVVFLFLFHVDTQLCTWIGFGQVSPSFRMGKGFC